jgi:hypothetical protein
MNIWIRLVHLSFGVLAMVCIALLVATNASAQTELSLAPNPKTLNFGTANSNTPVTLYDTIKSVGAAGTKLGISNIAFTGSIYYSQISGANVGDSILAGNYELIGIQFLPFAYGTETGTLTVTTTGVDSGTQATSLTGISAIPSVSYSASTMFAGTKVRLTDTSNVQYLYVHSTGIGPLAITGVNIIGQDGARVCFITHLPTGAIPAGGMDSIGVRFNPDFEGSPDARIVIASNAVNIPSDTVTSEGVGILPHLSIDSGKTYPLPLTLNFDSVGVGVNSCLQIHLWNPGTDTVAITKNYFTNADSDFTFTPLAGKDTLIPPGGTENIQVCFTPIKEGTRVATLRIHTDIPLTETTPQKDTSQFVVNIVGVGVPNNHGLIRGYQPYYQTYDTIMVGTTGCWIDTIKNIGNGPVKIDSIAIFQVSPGNSFPFTGSFPPFPVIIQPDSIMTFTLCATPTDTGIRIDPNNPDIGGAYIDVYTNPIFDDSSDVFGGFYVYGIEIGDTAGVAQPFSGGCGLDTETIWVLNTENVPEAYSASISGTNAADFTVLAPTKTPIDSAGDISTFTVVFKPSTASVETANLNITGGIPQTIALTARGGAAQITGTQAAPMTSLGQTSAPFTVTVNNTGSCPWTTGVPTVDPQFTYVSGAGTIAGGGSAPFVFTYTPSVAGGTTYPVTFTSSTGLTTGPPVVTITTGLDAVELEAVSDGFSLEQNYPNPFSGTSNVEITLPVGCLVHLAIINVEGQVVQTVLNQHYDAGSFEITLDVTRLASGTYYYQMTAGNVTLTRQMVVMK